MSELVGRDWMADDRRWFARYPGRAIRRRQLIEGEFPPDYVAPPGYRIEVLVEQAVAFTNGDALRLRWPILVRVEDAQQ